LVVRQVLPTLNLEEIHMQKKTIALAVAALVSGAAFAQSSVTLYGVADANYTYSKAGDNKFSGVDGGGWNGNRIGFRGEEALGNGLKAVYTAEFGYDIDVNSQFNQTRQSFVGLAGKFGSVTFGRQYAPSGSYLGATSSNDVTTVYPVNLALGANFITMNTGGGSRWNNSISYNSPNLSGFDFRFIYGFGEQIRDSMSDANSDASRVGLGLRYSNGPIYATAIYQETNDSADRVKDGEKAWALGGSYNFKVVQVFANYVQQKINSGSDNKQVLLSLGVAVPVSQAGKVRAEIMQFKNKVFDDDNKSRGFGVGYDHDLSKRTKIYTVVSRMSNDDNVNWGYSKTKLAGESNTNFSVGIRHFF
jgi:predicted porin